MPPHSWIECWIKPISLQIYLAELFLKKETRKTHVQCISYADWIVFISLYICRLFILKFILPDYDLLWSETTWVHSEHPHEHPSPGPQRPLWGLPSQHSPHCPLQWSCPTHGNEHHGWTLPHANKYGGRRAGCVQVRLTGAFLGAGNSPIVDVVSGLISVALWWSSNIYFYF